MCRSACPHQPLSISDPTGRLRSCQQPALQLRLVHVPVRLVVCCRSTSPARVFQADSKACAPIATSQWQSDIPHQHFHSNFLHVAAPLAPQQVWQNTQQKQRQEQQQLQQRLQLWSGEEPAAAAAVHHAASPARSAISEAISLTPASAAADVATWRVLQLQDSQDLLSARIVSCANLEQLLTAAQEVALHGNKLQVARLAVSAAILVQQQPQQHSLGAVLHQSSALVAGQLSVSSTPAAVAAQQHAALGPETQLLDKVVSALTCSTSAHRLSALRTLSSRYLAETLYAMYLLSQHILPGQQQQQHLQDFILAQTAQIPQQHILSAVHACSTAQQLSAVVCLLQSHLTQTHIKAAFVQLARVVASSSSGNRSNTTDSSSSHSLSTKTAAPQRLLELLLQLLADQQQPLSPHAAASILWSLGQLQPLLSGTPMQHNMQHLAQEAFEAALAGVYRLNHRVCAMMLHGAAKLQLQVPGDSGAAAEQILLHTKQQLEFCDPQALATLLWSIAELQLQPSNRWLQAFYSKSLQLLQPQQQMQPLPQQQALHSTNGHRANGSTQHPKALRHVQQRHSLVAAQQQRGQQQGRQQQLGQQQRHEPSSLKPQELAAILSSLVHLGCCPHVKWLVAAACSCHLQLRQFQHQELALMLWAFAKWQQQQGFAVPKQLVDHAGQRIQHLLAESSSTSTAPCSCSSSFSPNSLSLLLYAVVKLQLQPQGFLVQQLWRQLQQSRHGSWPELLGHMPCGDELPAIQQPMVAAVAAPAEAVHGHLDAAFDSAGWPHSAGHADTAAAAAEYHGVDVGAWVEQVYSQSSDELQQYNAHDLALLAWGLATQQHQQRHQQPAQQLRPPSADWVTCYMEAAGKQLRLRSSTAQGVCMMLWGLSVLVTKSNSVGAGASSSKQRQAVAAAFWAAVEQQTLQQLAQFSIFELSSILWGAGALHKYLGAAGVDPTFEWVDLVACQCLDGIEQLPISQVVTASQGLVWLQHPKGLSLLQQLLSDRWTGQVVALQPHEVLLLLRGCAHYKHAPERNVLQQLLAVVRQQLVAVQEPVAPAAVNVAQVLHVLGKMQQQYAKLQKQQHCSSRDEGGSAGRADQQQAVALVPSHVVLELAAWMTGRLASCRAMQVSMMMWGLSQLLAPNLQQHRQGTVASSEPTYNSSADVSVPVAADTACRVSGSHMCKRAHVALPDQPVGQLLLQEVYSYSSQHLDDFHPNELAVLMHSMHKLGVVHPPAQWLSAVVAHITPLMGHMHGQGLAVLIMSLSGFNWSPGQGWLTAYVDAAEAVDACGRLKTEWQCACIQHALSALDPIVGEAWQRRHSRAHSSRRSLAVAGSDRRLEAFSG